MSGVINYQFRLNGVLIFKIEFLIYYYVWYTNQCFMLYKVILAVVDCSPQHRGFGMSASISCKLAGPQQSEIDPQFLQTLQIGETGHKLRNWRKVSFYEYNKKLGNKMLPNFIFKIINPI